MYKYAYDDWGIKQGSGFLSLPPGSRRLGASSRVSSPRHSYSSPHHGSPRFVHHDMEWEDEFEFYDEGAPSRCCQCCSLLLSLFLSTIFYAKSCLFSWCLHQWPLETLRHWFSCQSFPFVSVVLYCSFFFLIALIKNSLITFSSIFWYHALI